MNRRYSFESGIASFGKYEAPTTDQCTIRVESDVLTGSKVGVIAAEVSVDKYEDVIGGSADFGNVDLFNDSGSSSTIGNN